MKYIFSILIVIAGTYKVVFSFIENQQIGHLFGLEINIWIYRLIWATLVIVSVLDIIKKRKTKV